MADAAQVLVTAAKECARQCVNLEEILFVLVRRVAGGALFNHIKTANH